MITPPISLDLSFPRKIVVETNVDGSGTEIAARCDLDFGQNKENHRQWQVVLTVHFEGKDGAPGPCQGCVEYVGLFTVRPDYPADKMPKLVAITCPSMLYSAIRELVALLTGRGPHRSVTLPTVSFQDETIRRVTADQPEAAPGLPTSSAAPGSMPASQSKTRPASRRRTRQS
jgi:preprotein translocase subunit SecB